MKIQLITDLNDNLEAVQLPIEEYLRLKQAAGESTDHMEYSTPKPQGEYIPASDPIEESEKENATQPKPTIHHSSCMTEILGRAPNKEYKHYTHTGEGSWLGRPKSGQRMAGPSESSLKNSDKNRDLPRTGSYADKKRYWMEGKGPRCGRK